MTSDLYSQINAVIILLILIAILYLNSLLKQLVALNRLPYKLTFVIKGKANKGEKMDLKVNYTESVSVVIEDKFNNVLTQGFDAHPAWGLADPTLGSVAVSADGLSVVITPSGKLGMTQLQLSGSIGGVAIAGSLDMNMIPGDAAQVVLQPASPVAQ
jgi:hypothetical protein